MAAEAERLEHVLDIEARNAIRTMATNDAGAIDAFLNKKIPSFDGY